jgi:hypothetical protein
VQTFSPHDIVDMLHPMPAHQSSHGPFLSQTRFSIVQASLSQCTSHLWGPLQVMVPEHVPALQWSDTGPVIVSRTVAQVPASAPASDAPQDLLHTLLPGLMQVSQPVAGHMVPGISVPHAWQVFIEFGGGPFARHTEPSGHIAEFMQLTLPLELLVVDPLELLVVDPLKVLVVDPPVPVPAPPVPTWSTLSWAMIWHPPAATLEASAMVMTPRTARVRILLYSLSRLGPTTAARMLARRSPSVKTREPPRPRLYSPA